VRAAEIGDTAPGLPLTLYAIRASPRTLVSFTSAPFQEIVSHLCYDVTEDDPRCPSPHSAAKRRGTEAGSQEGGADSVQALVAPPAHVSQMATAFLSPATLEAPSPDVLGTSWMWMSTADDAHHVAGCTDDGERDVFWSLVLVVLVSLASSPFRSPKASAPITGVVPAVA